MIQRRFITGLARSRVVLCLADWGIYASILV
jgi:hypothetical protein